VYAGLRSAWELVKRSTSSDPAVFHGQLLEYFAAVSEYRLANDVLGFGDPAAISANIGGNSGRDAR
jgi:hypothetical protein